MMRKGRACDRQRSPGRAEGVEGLEEVGVEEGEFTWRSLEACGYCKLAL